MLFVGAVLSADRLGYRHVWMQPAGEAGLEATVRDLTVRENVCCGLFRLRRYAGPVAGWEAVALDVEVPANYVGVLDGLVRQAEAGSAGRPA